MSSLVRLGKARSCVWVWVLILSAAAGFGPAGFGGVPARADTGRSGLEGVQRVQAERSFSFDIPAQSMTSALDAFVEITGWQLGYPSDLVADSTSAGVSGSMTAAEALSRLLSGSGLKFVSSAPGLATLEPFGVSEALELAPLIVTAQRVEEDERTVPISMEVITAEEIEDKGLQSLSDLISLVPNVGVEQMGSNYFSTLTVRGIGNEIPFTDPSVSVFVNGTPLPGGLSDFDLLDVERVEILRGPQSTLFGQNALAGAVNVVTKRPVHRGWSTKGGAKVGSHGFRSGSAALQGALVPGKASLGISANVAKSNGYVRNVTTGNRVGGADDRNLRVTLDAAPTDDLDLTVTLDHRRNVGGFVDSVESRSYDIIAPGDPREERRTNGAVGVLTWYGDDLEIVSQSGWRKLKLDVATRTSFPKSSSPFDLVSDAFTDERYLFQEFRLVGPKDDGPLGWQAGVYLADETFEVEQTAVSKFNLFSNTQTFLHEQDTRRYEGFGQLDYDVLEDLTLTLGGRLSQVERDVTHQYVSAPFLNQTFADSKSRDFFNAVGRVALGYSFTPGFLAYSSFSQGFKAGTARSGAIDAKGLFLPSERSNVFEVGLKGNALNTDLDLAFSYTDYKKRHTFFNTGTGNTSAIAIPEAEAFGVELGLDHQIQKGWNLFGRAGYLHTSFGDFTVTSDQRNDFDIGGNKFRAAPSWTAALGTNFQTEIVDGWKFFANGDFTYQSNSFGNIANSDTSRNSGYALFNAGLGIKKSGVTVSVSAQNLFDRYYFSSTTLSDGRGSPGPPRTVFAGVSIAFGS